MHWRKQPLIASHLLNVRTKTRPILGLPLRESGLDQDFRSPRSSLFWQMGFWFPGVFTGRIPLPLNHEYRLAVLDPFGDYRFSLKYTKNLGFWITYYPGAWNYDATVKALVIALWWTTTLLYVNSTEWLQVEGQWSIYDVKRCDEIQTRPALFLSSEKLPAAKIIRMKTNWKVRSTQKYNQNEKIVAILSHLSLPWALYARSNDCIIPESSQTLARAKFVSKS